MISKKYFYIAQTIGICCIIGTLITPLLLDPATLFPFVIFKNTIFRLLTTILFLIAIIIFISTSFTNSRWKNIIRKNIILVSLFIFILAAVLSMIFGVDAYNSFFSGGERMEGIITWAYLFLFLLSAITVILTTKNPLKQLHTLLKTNTIVSCLVGFIAIISYKTGFLLNSMQGNRLAGVSGNPAYLSSYMLLSAFLSIYVLFDNPSKKQRINWFYFSIFIFQSLILFGTGTRGAMVGWLAGNLLILVYFSIKYFRERIGKFSLAIICLGVLLISLVFIFQNTQVVKNSIGLSRLASISIKDITAQSRLYSARSALMAWKEKPIFGWGLENYKPAFLHHILPGMVANNPNDITFDKTHNMPLEILVTTGVIGFIAYMGIFMAIAKTLKKLYIASIENNQKTQVIILASGLIGYFVANLFLFDIFESHLLFILYCLIISALGLKEEFGTNSYKQQTPSDKYKIVLAVLTMVASVYILCLWTIKPYLDSRQFFAATQYLKSNDFKKSKLTIEKILKTETMVTRNSLNIYLKAFLATPDHLTETNAVEIAKLLDTKYRSLIIKHPNYFDLRSDHISLLVNNFYQDPIKLKEAEEEQVYLVNYAPNYVHYLDHLAFIYGLEGKYDLAQKEITSAISLTDKIPEPYWYQGIIYNMSGNPLSIDFLYKALKLGYVADMDEISKTVELALKYEKYSYLPDLYSLALVLAPNDPQLYASLAAAYQKIGDYDNARITAQKILELNPSLKPQVDAFLKTLPAK